MSYKLRPAIEKDIPHLVELRTEFLREIQIDAPEENVTYYEEKLNNYFTKHMKEGTFLAWFAESDDEIIATSGLSIIEKPPQLWNFTGLEAYIMNMYTKPEWRRKGRGSVLLEKLLEEAKQRGIHQITLHTTLDGKSLYEKFGFKLGQNEMHLKL